MKALVTGATGFTGRTLVEKLTGDGAQVRLLVRDRERWQAKGSRPGIELIEGDIRDPQSVAQAVGDVDTVFHLAALYRTAGMPDQAYWDVHVTGTANLLQAAQAAGVRRFVHCSTVGVHGHIEKPPADESYRMAPGDEYQRSKLEGERLVLRCHEETGLPVTVIRPTPIYGPHDMRLLKLFRLAGMRPRLILGSGEIFYHMVYVDDLVQSFLLAAENDAAVGEVFIVGGEEFLTLNQLLDRIGATLGRSGPTLHFPALPVQLLGSICERICQPFGLEPPLYRRRVDFFTKSRAFCIDKAKRVLGYQPKVMLEEGLERTIASYRSLGLRMSSLYAFLSAASV
jgi:dihydroflavonol-4-reductase